MVKKPLQILNLIHLNLDKALLKYLLNLMRTCQSLMIDLFLTKSNNPLLAHPSINRWKKRSLKHGTFSPQISFFDTLKNLTYSLQDVPLVRWTESCIWCKTCGPKTMYCNDCVLKVHTYILFIVCIKWVWVLP